MKQIAAFLLLTLAALLSSCAVIRTDFFQPAGEGIEYTGSFCGNSINDTALIKHDAAYFYLKIQPRAEADELMLTIEIPQGNSVQLPTPSLLVNQLSYPLPSPVLYERLKSNPYTGTATLIGAGIRKRRLIISEDTPTPRKFIYSLKLPNHQGQYRVQLPEMRVNGNTFRFPEILYRFSHKMHTSPINC